MVVRLLVLGVIALHGQAHGYAVHRELLSWKVETWTSVKPGSLYHALKQLNKEGMLLAADKEESKEGPGRTLYQLTQKGSAELHRLLEAALSSFQLEELGAGVAFMQILSRQQVIGLLQEQRRKALENSAHLERLVPSFSCREEPPHTQDLLTLWSGNLTATASWVERLVQRLEAGEYVMAGEERRTPSAPSTC